MASRKPTTKRTSKSKPKLMEGFKQRQNLGRDMGQTRWEAPLRYCTQVAQDTASRVTESRKSFPWKFFRGDFHSHTQHSDGIGTVEETATMVKAAGLDFQFVTDHWGITQTPECKKHGLWVGQEPGTQHHHLGILGLDHAYTPKPDLLYDFNQVKKLGGTPFIPHPTGWFPRTVYNQEQLDALNGLPKSFLMEIINGASNIVTAFDYTDRSAVALWDKLLCDGKHIHAMGNTDAHIPHSIGMVWNGVMAARCDQKSIIKTISAGRSFVSEAPLLNITLGRAGMGSVVRTRTADAPLKITVVDSRGLLRVRVIGDGKPLKTWHFDEEPLCQQDYKIPAKIKQYIRVEAISSDGRRGYTNPIYFQ